MSFSYAFLAAMVWGLNYALCELVLEKISVLSFLAISFCLSTIIFLVIAYFYHLKTDLIYLLSHQKTLYFLFLQVITFIFATLFISLAIKTSNNATLSALIESIYPLFTMVFLYLFFQKNHFDWRFFSAALLILGGLVLIQIN